jgi:hypothetical protein
VDGNIGRVRRSACVGLMVALAAIGACDGKTIHLGNGRCIRGQVSASEVLWIGDSWVLIPGNQHTAVSDSARMAGAIGSTDDYVIGAAPATTMATIANQYTTQEAGATKVKVLIMDGGTWDTIQSGGSDASVSSVVTAFGELLAQVASDGTVENLIYFLTPELPGIPGVAALRPLLKQACEASTVRCRFLDLQTVWAGHADEYTAPGPIPVPTEAGGIAIADAIWSLMQQGCIAQ